MTLPPEIPAPSASADVVISEGILAAQREAEALADEMDAEHNEVLPAVPKVLQLPIKVIEQQVQERKGASSRLVGRSAPSAHSSSLPLSLHTCVAQPRVSSSSCSS